MGTQLLIALSRDLNEHVFMIIGAMLMVGAYVNSLEKINPVSKVVRSSLLSDSDIWGFDPTIASNHVVPKHCAFTSIGFKSLGVNPYLCTIIQSLAQS